MTCYGNLFRTAAFSPVAEMLVILYPVLLWTSLITPTGTWRRTGLFCFIVSGSNPWFESTWLQCWARGEIEPQQKVYGRAKKVLSQWKEDRCREGKKPGHVPGDLLPPRGPHLLKSHSAMNLSVNEWTHDPVFSPWYHWLGMNPSIYKSLGIISYQTITTVLFVWDTRLFLIF